MSNNTTLPTIESKPERLTIAAFLRMNGINLKVAEFCEFANESQPTLKSWLDKPRYNHRMKKLVELFHASNKKMDTVQVLANDTVQRALQNKESWSKLAPDESAGFLNTKTGVFIRVSGGVKHGKVEEFDDDSSSWRDLEMTPVAMLDLVSSTLAPQPTV